MSQLRIMLCCLVLAFIAQPVFADEMASLKLGYQLLAPSGTLAGSNNGVDAQVDVENDLNLDDSQSLTAEIAFQLGQARLSLGFLPMDYSGTGVMTASGTYNGQTFTANQAVQSEVKLNVYDLGLTYNLINMDDSATRFQFGPELAVKVVDAEVNLVVAAAGINEQDSATVPIPTIGARARIGLSDFLAIVGRAGYLEINGNHFLDAEAQVEFSPIPTIGIYGGYRTFDLKIDETDVYVDVDFKGPFVGAFFRF